MARPGEADLHIAPDLKEEIVMPVRVERSSRVLTVIQSRPEARNAVDPGTPRRSMRHFLRSTRMIRRMWQSSGVRVEPSAPAQTSSAWQRVTQELNGRDLPEQPLVQRRARLQALLARAKSDLLRFQ
jgi:hypothetical protein